MGAPNHPIRHLAARNEVKIAFSDHSAAEAVFGVGAKTTLEAGLSKMATWVRREGARRTPKFDAIEISKLLPPSWLS